MGALLSPQQKNRPPAASMRQARRRFSNCGGRGQSPAVKSVAGTLQTTSETSEAQSWWQSEGGEGVLFAQQQKTTDALEPSPRRWVSSRLLACREGAW